MGHPFRTVHVKVLFPFFPGLPFSEVLRNSRRTRKNSEGFPLLRQFDCKLNKSTKINLKTAARKVNRKFIFCRNGRFFLEIREAAAAGIPAFFARPTPIFRARGKNGSFPVCSLSLLCRARERLQNKKAGGTG